ncbi:DUF6390 family protein [Pseudonocardia asaccharolytica]|uniref:DUF6390 family protein n=1 Tax=Pseudonocardia asaccharolytica TaxID=54010 RepID=UPI000426F41E|nr:DUF6390 family protein [Pseudonocardia asaccharolytica]
MVEDTRGAWLFARYAYAPNKLGYCGPPDSGTLADAGSVPSATADVRAVARRFSGAWPYLEVLAKLTGLEDPLDSRLVESYWLGGGVGAQISPRAFGEELLARIAPQAGHYWAHLTPELLDEAAGDHCFHVFGVYPWSRLLTTVAHEHPLHVLDSCRIRWGTVLSRHDGEIIVRSRRLTWNGSELALAESTEERVAVAVDGLSFLPDVAPGDQVALHWQWLCDRLSDDQVTGLEASTLRQIEVTNRRLAREREAATPGSTG